MRCKAGQEVKIIANKSCHGFYKGDIITISKIETARNGEYQYYRSGSWCFGEEECIPALPLLSNKIKIL